MNTENQKQQNNQTDPTFRPLQLLKKAMLIEKDEDTKPSKEDIDILKSFSKEEHKAFIMLATQQLGEIFMEINTELDRLKSAKEDLLKDLS
jgi:hypothetical protein